MTYDLSPLRFILKIACFGKRSDRLDALLHVAAKDYLGEEEDDGSEEQRRWPELVDPINDASIAIIAVAKGTTRILDDWCRGETPDLIRELVLTILMNDLEGVAAVGTGRLRTRGVSVRPGKITDVRIPFTFSSW